jgi:hypothetical protein
LKFSLERFLFLFARWFVSSGSYSYPSTQARDHLINAIGGRGTQGRAQSKPTHAKAFSEQVRQRAAPTFQSGF